MRMTFMRRFLYYVVYVIASTFFILSLIDQRRFDKTNSLSESTLFMVMFVTYYISKEDREFLKGSVSIRVLMFVAGALGLIRIFVIL